MEDFVGTIYLIGASLFLGRLISECLIPDAHKFLEEFGGCDCGDEDCQKIDEIARQGDVYRRVSIQDNKMTYRYSSIYNVTQAKWAHNVSGNNDYEKVWKDNAWDENDSLVGFYEENGNDCYCVIFCRPGYAIYVLGDDEMKDETFEHGQLSYRLPPAVLVNLNDAFDADFLIKKKFPDDSDSSHSEILGDSEEDEPQGHLKTHIPENQRIIEFLYRCRDVTDNPYKKMAYRRAINEVYSSWSTIGVNHLGKIGIESIGPSIERKISEFLSGFPEEDIIRS
jgi:hypothetical protein